MIASAWRGLLLATIAVVASASPECDGSTQGVCDADDHLSSSKEELAGLELLQVEVRLTNELVSAPAVHRPEAPSKPSQAANLMEVEVGATSSVDDAAPVAAVEKVVTLKKQASASDIGLGSAVSSMSLIETSSSVHHQSLHAMEIFVAGLREQGVSTILMVVILVAVFSILMFLAFQMLSGGGKQGMASMSPFSMADPAAAPSAQMLLQAPRSTNLAQSPIMSQALLGSGNINPGSGGLSLGELPPICPSLILPHTEARFMIPIDSLMQGSGDLEIRGTSGRKLLHGSVSETSEGRRCLALASVGCEEDPRVTVLAPPREISPRPQGIDTMQLYGKGGKFYGTLEAAVGGGAVLRCEGQAVMSLEIGDGDLRMTASSMDGRLLASAGKNVQVSVRRMESADTWKLQVKPNYDAVLIAACMLAALVFAQGEAVQQVAVEKDTGFRPHSQRA